MLKQPADDFINALSTTINDYKSKVKASRAPEDLTDMSSHMIAALGAVRSQQVSIESSRSSQAESI